MAPDTDSPRSDDRELRFGFSTRVSLTPRILFVNIFALALLAFGFFYLDSYRSRLVDPVKEDTGQRSARFLDAMIDTVVNAARAPLYREHDAGFDWPDVRTARDTHTATAPEWRCFFLF